MSDHLDRQSTRVITSDSRSPVRLTTAPDNSQSDPLGPQEHRVGGACPVGTPLSGAGWWVSNQIEPLPGAESDRACVPPRSWQEAVARGSQLSRFRRLLLVLALLASACALPPVPTTPTPSSASPSALATVTADACAGLDPHAHVYQPARLVLQAPCVTASGLLEAVRAEADGDVHIRLVLDPGQERLVNAKNVSDQRGALVLEIVCVGTVTQADAIDACAGFTQPLRVPAAGQHIRATGPWELDTEHGWLELHPVYAWERIP